MRNSVDPGTDDSLFVIMHGEPGVLVALESGKVIGWCRSNWLPQDLIYKYDEVKIPVMNKVTPLFSITGGSAAGERPQTVIMTLRKLVFPQLRQRKLALVIKDSEHALYLPGFILLNREKP